MAQVNATMPCALCSSLEEQSRLSCCFLAAPPSSETEAGSGNARTSSRPTILFLFQVRASFVAINETTRGRGRALAAPGPREHTPRPAATPRSPSPSQGTLQPPAPPARQCGDAKHSFARGAHLGPARAGRRGVTSSGPPVAPAWRPSSSPAGGPGPGLAQKF